MYEASPMTKDEVRKKQGKRHHQGLADSQFVSCPIEDLWRGREILLDYDKQFTTKEKYEANKIN
jgi:hypothetical protein